MSKVFEALRRQQQNEKDNEFGRDPLAARVGTPEAPISNKTWDHIDEGFGLPSMIGVPDGPRSNEGMVLPSFDRTDEGQEAGEPAELREQPPELRDGPRKNKKRKVAIIKRGQQEIPVEQLSMARLHPRLILLTDPQTPECEQFRTLRTELFHASAKKQTQVVTVTSAVGGEGKTSTVLNLAFAIAQSKEKRVLVVDGDLRRPNIALYLGIRPTVGFTEILNGENDIFSSIFRLEGQDLYVLPVSRESNHPTELLSSERLETMLAQVREYFDFILIDSPPIMPFADSRLLANHSDAVIMVVRAGMATYDTVERAIDSLPQGRVLGIVLNGAEHKQEAGYYDNYRYYAQREQNQRTVRSKIANGLNKIGIVRRKRS